MAIFLRGNVWWFEWRTRKERVVRTTGFRKEDRAKAQAVFDAFRLAKGTKPRRTVVEGILDAIYAEKPQEGLALTSVWAVYEDWCKGKGKVLAAKTVVERRGMVERFVGWCGERGLAEVGDVDVSVAREYVGRLRGEGRSNKTLRNTAATLGGIWEAVGQMRGGLANPWKAATPDSDGSSVRREAFAADEEARVLAAAEKIGHGWWLASVVARWTGLRYGDVAQLEWKDVDMAGRVIRLEPSKTKKHGVRVTLPMSDVLWEALRGARVATSANLSGGDGFVLAEHGLKYPHPFLPAFSEVLREAGLDTERYTFHSWRHTFRTRLAEAGVSDEVARRLGGWTNLEMAAHYDHASRLNELREAIGKMR